MEERDSDRPRVKPHGAEHPSGDPKKDAHEFFTLDDEPAVRRPRGENVAHGNVPDPSRENFEARRPAVPPRNTSAVPDASRESYEARRDTPPSHPSSPLPDHGPVETHRAVSRARPDGRPLADPTAGNHEVRRPPQSLEGRFPTTIPDLSKEDTHVSRLSHDRKVSRAPLVDESARPHEIRNVQPAKGAPRDSSFLEQTRDIEVKKDHADRPALPPLQIDEGQIEVESDAGRTKVRVLTTGVFDLIHLGHIHMLEAARKLGDELVVVIARDETVRKMKHEPINAEEVRRQIVSALRPVSKAVLGHHGDIYRIVEELRPDIVALGFDQKFTNDEVRKKCHEHGVDVQVVRLPQFDHDLDATRKIIDRIAERIGKNELYTAREG